MALITTYADYAVVWCGVNVSIEISKMHAVTDIKFNNSICYRLRGMGEFIWENDSQDIGAAAGVASAAAAAATINGSHNKHLSISVIAFYRNRSCAK